jgi:hypothetical protein
MSDDPRWIERRVIAGWLTQRADRLLRIAGQVEGERWSKLQENWMIQAFTLLNAADGIISGRAPDPELVAVGDLMPTGAEYEALKKFWVEAGGASRNLEGPCQVGVEE